MRFLLDTSVCVDYLNGRYPGVVQRVQESDPADLGISSVVAAELRYGAEHSRQPRRNHDRLDILLSELPVVAFDGEAARVYGRVRQRLENRGEIIGPYDMMIAAHALCLQLALVTDNVRKFGRFRSLKVINWRS